MPDLDNFVGAIMAKKIVLGLPDPCRVHLKGFWGNIENHQNGVGKSEKMKVLRMRFSIVENVPTSRGIIFKISRGSQRPYRAKSKKI